MSLRLTTNRSGFLNGIIEMNKKMACANPLLRGAEGCVSVTRNNTPLHPSTLCSPSQEGISKTQFK
jgi:hypothetical protein